MHLSGRYSLWAHRSSLHHEDDALHQHKLTQNNHSPCKLLRTNQSRFYCVRRAMRYNKHSCTLCSAAAPHANACHDVHCVAVWALQATCQPAHHNVERVCACIGVMYRYDLLPAGTAVEQAAPS
jgi:hypothetical protein